MQLIDFSSIKSAELLSKKAGFILFALCLSAVLLPLNVFAHGVDDSTRQFLETETGIAIVPFLYIGAKHMVTGYDHLLFLIGVLFFLRTNKDVVLYVSLFTLGHSITLISGVLANIQLNAYLIDAVIGLSVVYKGFDNLGGFKQIIGKQPNTKIAVLIFGLFHGFGLATKIQEFGLESEGLAANLLAFNLGVELGQIFALVFILILLNLLRTHSKFTQLATLINTGLMCAGFMLIGLQLTGYLVFA